ncbi:BglG family transcription antiterminator [Streptococcus thoraltensis]
MKHRQLSILHDLIVSDTYLTAKVLSEKYSVSTKTIYNDLEELKAIFDDVSDNLEKIPRKGILLSMSDGRKKRLLNNAQKHFGETPTIRAVISKELLLLNYLAFETEELDIIDFSVEYYISESSIRRGLENLEESFSSYDIHLERSHGKYKLTGDEQEIRKYLRNYFIENLNLSISDLSQNSQFNTFFSKEEINFVIATLHHLSASYKFIIDEQYKLYLLLDLLISMKRSNMKKLITRETHIDLITNLIYYEVYSFATDLYRELVLIDDSVIPEGEIIHLVYSLLSVGYEKSDVIDSEHLVATVKQFITRVGELLRVNLSTDDHLFRMLLCHIQPMVFRLKNRIVINNDITEEIKKKYNVLYNIVWLSSKELSDVFEIVLTDGEIALLTVHFEISLEKLAKPLTIYLVAPQGIATTELIMNSLNRIISNFDRLIKIESKKLTPEKIAHADLIISSIYIDNPSNKFVFISPILTSTDFTIIQNRYSHLLEGSRRMLSVIENESMYTQSLVQKLLGNSIIINLDVKDVNSCLDFMVSMSSENNQSNTEFIKSIKYREKLGSTSLYTGVALPHADPSVVKESQLIMATLRKPIRWGSNMVKVIMLISISEADELLYKDALISLYSKIDDTTYIDKLWHAENSEEFLSLLVENEMD